MRSRAGRLTLSVVAVIGIGAAAAFLFYSERQLMMLTGAQHAFDLAAREASDALADLRSAQQAYVADGQGVAFWMPQVAATTDRVTVAIDALRRSATDADARAQLDEAAAHLNEFGATDKRARDYLKSNQPLMAGDVIFTEGLQTVAATARAVAAARTAEDQGFDAVQLQKRMQEAAVAAAAGGVAILALLVLASLAPTAIRSASGPPAPRPAEHPSPAAALPLTEMPTASLGPVMKAIAELATDLGRAQDLEDLARLLSRAADLMEARGLIVWVGGLSGDDLRPVLAHGYSPHAIAKLPVVSRSGDNAAALAYRTGSLRIVLSRPGEPTGAIVAPILTANGCIGAVSAEIRNGGEASETTQALAVLVAAQLANVIGVQEAPAVSAEQDVRKSRTV